MSMTLAAAKITIARVAGAASDPNKIALAADAIKATAQKWTNKTNWEWLRKDNSLTRALSGTTASASPIITAVDPDTAGLNVGQSVTGTGIPASTTILTVDSLTQVTLDKNATASATVTLTFGAYIPVLVGVANYFLPHDFKDFYSARLLTSKRRLEIVRQRQADREMPDQETQRYTVGIMPAPYGSGAGFTAADQRARAVLIGLPDAAENLLLHYYRGIDGTADPIDIPEDYEMTFLDDCKAWFLAQINSNDPRISLITGLANKAVEEAIVSDKEISDEDVRLKSQMEIFETGYIERGYPLRGF